MTMTVQSEGDDSAHSNEVPSSGEAAAYDEQARSLNDRMTSLIEDKATALLQKIDGAGGWGRKPSEALHFLDATKQEMARDLRTGLQSEVGHGKELSAVAERIKKDMFDHVPGKSTPLDKTDLSLRDILPTGTVDTDVSADYKLALQVGLYKLAKWGGSSTLEGVLSNLHEALLANPELGVEESGLFDAMEAVVQLGTAGRADRKSKFNFQYLPEGKSIAGATERLTDKISRILADCGYESETEAT